jgi:flagellar basal body-associated protein FliL
VQNEGKSKGKLIWLIVVPIFLVFGVSSFILARKLRQRHRHPRHTHGNEYAEASRKREDDEIILFELKENNVDFFHLML